MTQPVTKKKPRLLETLGALAARALIQRLRMKELHAGIAVRNELAPEACENKVLGRLNYPYQSYHCDCEFCSSLRKDKEAMLLVKCSLGGLTKSLVSFLKKNETEILARMESMGYQPPKEWTEAGTVGESPRQNDIRGEPWQHETHQEIQTVA